MAGRVQPELARRGEVHNPGLQHAVVDDGALPVAHALAVEGLGAQAALAMRVVDDADAGGKDAAAELVFEEARAARDRRAADRADEVADERARDARIED